VKEGVYLTRFLKPEEEITLAEAADIWRLSDSSVLRHAIKNKIFNKDEYTKHKGITLIKVSAMERVYGSSEPLSYDPFAGAIRLSFNNLDVFSDPIKIVFNEHEFNLLDTLYYGGGKYEKNGYKEILPGIYFYQSESLMGSMLNNLRYIIINSRFDNLREVINLKIIINNRRDNIEVYQKANYKDNNSEAKNYRLIYKSVLDSNDKGSLLRISPNKRYNIDIMDYDYEDFSMQWISPSNITIFPEVMGGGGHQCELQNAFILSQLLNNSRAYTILGLEEVLTATSESSYFLDYCQNCKNCMNIRELLVNSEKNEILSSRDHITLSEYGGYYFPTNGNHRICVAKRFNIPRIYAQVNHHKLKSKIAPKSHNSFYNLTKFKIKTTEVLSDCYSSFAELGLTKQDVRFILSEGLHGLALIEYIEKTTGKNLDELYREGSDRVWGMYKENG
jgi:hypothetical protein